MTRRGDAAAGRVRVTREAAARYLLYRLGLLSLTPAGGSRRIGTSTGTNRPGAPRSGPEPAPRTATGEGVGSGGRQRADVRDSIAPPGVEAVLNRLGAIQLDPVNVVERNHHLVLFNRVRGYRPEWLEALYPQGKVFEAWCHARCVLPVAWYPAFRLAFRRHADGDLDPAVREWMDRIVALVAVSGPLSSRQIEAPDRVVGYWDRDQPGTRAVSQALQHLWEEGRLAVCLRRGNERWYDLPERVLPDEVRSRHLDEAEASEQRLRHYAQALVLFDPGDPYFGWRRWPAARRREEAERRVATGQWVRVAIEGVRRVYYAVAEDRDILQNAGDLPVLRAARFLPPLDNLLWRRTRLVDLFGFEYAWEIYLPTAKRRYGPYTMPVLYRNRLVGRIDLAFRQSDRTLTLQRLRIEPSSEGRSRAIREAVAAEVERLGHYLGAEKIEGL